MKKSILILLSLALILGTLVSCDGTVDEKLWGTVTVPLDCTEPDSLPDLTGTGIKWDNDSKTLYMENARLILSKGYEFCIKLPAGATIDVTGTNVVTGYECKLEEDEIKGIYAVGNLTIIGHGKDNSSLTVTSGNNTQEQDEEDNESITGQTNGIFVEQETSLLSIKDITLTSTGGKGLGNRSVGIYCFGSIEIDNSVVTAKSMGTVCDDNSIGYGIYRNKKLTVTSSTVTAEKADGFVGLYFNGIYGLTSKLAFANGEDQDYDYGATEISGNSTVTTWSYAKNPQEIPALGSVSVSANDFAFLGCNSLKISNSSELICKTDGGKGIFLTTAKTVVDIENWPLIINDSAKITSYGTVIVDKKIQNIMDTTHITNGQAIEGSSGNRYYGNFQMGDVNHIEIWVKLLKCVERIDTTKPMTITKATPI